MKLLKHLSPCLLLGAMVACTFPNGHHHSEHDTTRIDSSLFKLRDIDKLKLKEDSFIATNNKKNELVCKLTIGRRYRELAQFNEALEYHQAAYDLATQLSDTLEMMNATLQLGTNFRRIGSNEEASKFYYQGLHLYDMYSDKANPNVNKAMVSILNGLGNVEQELGNSRESIHLFFRSLNEAQNNTTLNRAINYSNIGDSYSRMNMIDSAKYYYKISLEANLEAKVPTGIGLGYINSGNIFKRANQIDSAIVYYQKAYDILDSTKDRWHWLISCNALADIYLNTNELSKARHYVEEGLDEIKTLKSLRGKRDVYYFTSVLYEKNGNYKDALYYTRLANELADSLRNEKSSDNIIGLKLSYERETAKHQTELLLEQNRSQRKSTTIIILGSIALLSLTILIFTIYLSYARRKNMKKLQAAYIDLQAMHKRAERAEQMKSAFIQSITHEVRTPLNAIQGFGELIIHGNYSDEMKAEFYQEMERGINNLTEQVNNMLDLSNFSTGQIDIHKDEIYAQTIVRDAAKEINSLVPEGVTLRLETPQDNLLIQTDSIRIAQVLHNLLTNACKNTTEGYITIGVNRKSSGIQFYVEDTGCGIPEDMAEAIFGGFEKSDSFKPGMGIGLRLSILICDALDARLQHDKSYTNGARFTIDLKEDVLIQSEE